MFVCCWFVSESESNGGLGGGGLSEKKGYIMYNLVVYIIFGPCPFTHPSQLFFFLSFFLFFFCWFLCLLGFNWICSLLSFSWTCTAFWASCRLLTEGFSALEVYSLLLLLLLLSLLPPVLLSTFLFLSLPLSTWDMALPLLSKILVIRIAQDPKLDERQQFAVLLQNISQQMWKKTKTIIFCLLSSSQLVWNVKRIDDLLFFSIVNITPNQILLFLHFLLITCTCVLHPSLTKVPFSH